MFGLFMVFFTSSSLLANPADPVVLACWETSNHDTENVRQEWNDYQGRYQGRLSIDLQKAEVSQSVPNGDGPTGKHYDDFGGKFKIIKPFVLPEDLPWADIAEGWIYGFDEKNKQMLAVNRKSGKLMMTGFNFARSGEGKYAIEPSFFKGYCEVKLDHF
jgi:hypothetical protein